MKTQLTTILVFAGVLLAWPLHAEDNPEQLVRAQEQAVQQEVTIKEEPGDRWRAFLEERGWNGDMAAGGVIIVPERELIISSATVYTKVRLGQPGWIESRVFAFEQAEMEAKAKIIRYMSETAETKRTMSMLSNASWQDGDVERVQELNDVSETLKRIGKKSLDLAEAELNSALQKLDPDYDPNKYANQSPKDLQVTAETMFNRQVKAVAMKTLIGVTPLYSTEGKDQENEYAVLVGVVWSPKLNRLAMSLFNDEYNIPKVRAGKKVTQHVPQDELALIATSGTRIVVDENGQYAVLAYGQAQPRRTNPGRKQAALHDATQIAANRARAQLLNFIREGMTLRGDEIGKELSREFSDMDFATNITREYRKIINSKKVKVQLRGLRTIKEWHYEHPATGQVVAGSVLAWSPASAALSRKADQMLNNSQRKKETARPVEKNKAGQSDEVTLQSMEVDTGAY
ncbi:MAG: hypothetical protein CSA32_04145 [Desulfobulbus propionicus]|nr:MAG: hypothetical protein CSA32_04145 [Desulfobulbus propionicus]